MKEGTLICFVGIDGSGKTTIAKKVNNDLKKKGIESKYIYGRVVPVASRLLMWAGRKFLLKRKKDDMFNDYEEYTNQKRKIFKNNVISKIYIWSILFDQTIQANIKIKNSLNKKRVIICDRYLIDTVITDIVSYLCYSKDEIISLINRLFYIMPIPDIIFIIDVPEDVAYSRKNDIPHINYIKERRKLYLEFGESIGVEILDGTKDVNELSNIVIMKLKTIFGDLKYE